MKGRILGTFPLMCIAVSMVDAAAAPSRECSTIKCKFDQWRKVHNQIAPKLLTDAAREFDAFAATMKRLAQREANGLEGHGLTAFAATPVSQFQIMNGYVPLNITLTHHHVADSAAGVGNLNRS